MSSVKHSSDNILGPLTGISNQEKKYILLRMGLFLGWKRRPDPALLMHSKCLPSISFLRNIAAPYHGEGQ